MGERARPCDTPEIFRCGHVAAGLIYNIYKIMCKVINAYFLCHVPSSVIVT